jgi:hypothetical protein
MGQSYKSGDCRHIEVQQKREFPHFRFVHDIQSHIHDAGTRNSKVQKPNVPKAL